MSDVSRREASYHTYATCHIDISISTYIFIFIPNLRWIISIIESRNIIVQADACELIWLLAC